VAVYEIFRSHVLHSDQYPDWRQVCRHWKLDPAHDAYGVAFAADSEGVKWRLVTTDTEFVRELPMAGPAPEHEWLEVTPGWFVAT
jgi:hypothetical protein